MIWSSKDILAKHSMVGKTIPKVLKIVKTNSIAGTKLCVGDTVLISNTLKVVEYDKISVVPAMLSYRGMAAKITVVKPYKNRYNINIDEGRWAWSSEMFEEGIDWMFRARSTEDEMEF